MRKNKLAKVAIKAVNMYHCRTIFPFFYTVLDINEDELTITKVDGVHRDTKKIQIPNLSSVESGHGPLFGHVRVLSKYMTTGEVTIKWLTARDARKFTEKANELMAEFSSDDTSGGQ